MGFKMAASPRKKVVFAGVAVILLLVRFSLAQEHIGYQPEIVAPTQQGDQQDAASTQQGGEQGAAVAHDALFQENRFPSAAK